MGSSPVTATNPPSPADPPLDDPALAPLIAAAERCLVSRLGAGDGVLVAFSGGTDSTALLWTLAQLAPRHGWRLHAAHLDHRLDPDAPRRARRARQLADRLGVAMVSEHLDDAPPPGRSVEDFARRRRYRFLARSAADLGLGAVATAHHADDQAETLVLRLLYGGGLPGLAGIRRRHGALIRPFLGLRRHQLAAAVRTLGLEPVADPTNADPAQPRARVRHHLLPRLERLASGSDLSAALARVATAAAGAGERIGRMLDDLLDPRPARAGVAVDRRAFERLPEPLLPHALGQIARHADAPYPAAASVRDELLRQLRQGRGVGCSAGHGWRFEADSRTLFLLRGESSPGDVTYTLRLPGAIDMPELGRRMRIERGEVAPWMFRGRSDRAGLSGALEAGRTVVVRNRRPGDRIRPLGSRRPRRLKELLIDYRVPRHERDLIPLLVIDGKIAWVPGVTIGEEFRIAGDSSVWIATIE